MPNSGSWSTGHSSTATAATRPPQPATTVPRWTLPVTRHTTALSTRPPSSGSPGTRLSSADQQVGADQALDHHPQQPVGRDEPEPPARPAPTASEVSGPTTAIKNSCRGVRASPSIAVIAAEEVQGDRGDREAVVAGHQRVRGLVQQHREVEQDREGQPGDVLPGTEAGLDRVDRAARRRSRSGRRRGTRTPETSTSLPAIVPIRKRARGARRPLRHGRGRVGTRIRAGHEVEASRHRARAPAGLSVRVA